jgi:hypothetical protein
MHFLYTMNLYQGSTHTLPFLLETTQSKYKRHKCTHTHWLQMRMDRSTIVQTIATYSERHTTSICHHSSYYYHCHILLASTITAHTTTITGSWKSSHYTGYSKMWLLDQLLLQSMMPHPCIPIPGEWKGDVMCVWQQVMNGPLHVTPVAKRAHPHSFVTNTVGPPCWSQSNTEHFKSCDSYYSISTGCGGGISMDNSRGGGLGHGWKELHPKCCNRVPLILLHKLVNPFIFNT